MTPRARPSLTQGYNLNNFGSGPLGEATYNIKDLGLLVSDKKIFKGFSL